MKWKILQIYICSILFEVWKKPCPSSQLRFFPFVQTMLFCLQDRIFSTCWQGMCVIVNNQIYTYFQHKGKCFNFFWQIIRCPWNTCPLCYHSKMLYVTECSLSKFPAFCTITHSKLPLIQNETIAVCFEDNIAEKSKCVGKYKRNNESCPLCYVYIDDMFDIFAT